MSDLKLYLFGTPHFEYQGHTVEGVQPQLLALATFLALTDKVQTRESLATFFSPALDEQLSLSTLDEQLQALANIAPIPWLTLGEPTLSINTDLLANDAREFISAITTTRAHLHSDGRLCNKCFTSLKQAVDLYQAEFMVGFDLPNCPEFQDWQLKQQQWLNRECTNALRRLAEHATTDAISQAIGFAQRWADLSPLNEKAHRLLMRLYVANDQRAKALQQYEHCVRLVDEALATPPEDVTTQLYEAIRQGETPALEIGTKTLLTEVSIATYVLPPLPSLVIGREQALRDIKARLGIPSSKPKHGVTILEGWPGVGKSTTVGALAHDPEVKTRFPDGILWASLGENPNLLGSLLAWGEALQLVESKKTIQISDLSAQIKAALQNRSMLLIVDDVWQPEHATPFQIQGEQGALIITTRLNAVATALAPSPTDIYRLPILSDDYALALLLQLAPESIRDYPQEALELVHSLEGLPLAIQVAGRLLHEEIRRGRHIGDLIRELKLGSSLLTAEVPNDMGDKGYTIPTIGALLKRSTDCLDEESLERFALLSLFVPKPATFDLSAMAAAWDIEDPKPTARLLVNRGLIEPISAGRFQMHALLVLHSQSLLQGD